MNDIITSFLFIISILVQYIISLFVTMSTEFYEREDRIELGSCCIKACSMSLSFLYSHIAKEKVFG
jgi:hypothetical protein